MSVDNAVYMGAHADPPKRPGAHLPTPLLTRGHTVGAHGAHDFAMGAGHHPRRGWHASGRGTLVVPLVALTSGQWFVVAILMWVFVVVMWVWPIIKRENRNPHIDEQKRSARRLRDELRRHGPSD